MMEFLLSVGIFFLPKIVKAPKLDAKAKKLLRWVLLNKFLTNMEWRVGVAACFFFAIHVLIVTPYRIYSEDQNVIADQKNRASEDYISENRAYLEAWLLIESVTNNQVFYHYEVENKGKLPATSITERQ